MDNENNRTNYIINFLYNFYHEFKFTSLRELCFICNNRSLLIFRSLWLLSTDFHLKRLRFTLCDHSFCSSEHGVRYLPWILAQIPTGETPDPQACDGATTWPVLVLSDLFSDLKLFLHFNMSASVHYLHWNFKKKKKMFADVSICCAINAVEVDTGAIGACVAERGLSLGKKIKVQPL